MKIVQFEGSKEIKVFHRTEQEVMDTVVGAIYVAHFLRNITDGDVALLTNLADDLSIDNMDYLSSYYGVHSLPYLLVDDSHKMGFEPPDIQFSLLEFVFSDKGDGKLLEVVLHYENNTVEHLNNFSLSMARIIRYWFEGKI